MTSCCNIFSNLKVPDATALLPLSLMRLATVWLNRTLRQQYLDPGLLKVLLAAGRFPLCIGLTTLPPGHTYTTTEPRVSHMPIAQAVWLGRAWGARQTVVGDFTLVDEL
jgi:hypothetical protein